jgi:hypothetical protein
MESVSWTKIHTLRPGDKLSLEIVETTKADEPLHRARTEAFSIEAAERNQLRHLQKKYGRASAKTSGGRSNKAGQRAGSQRKGS